MPEILEHPDITHCLRTGYPDWVKEPEDLSDEDEEEADQNIWEDEFLDDLFQEMRERNRG